LTTDVESNHRLGVRPIAIRKLNVPTYPARLLIVALAAALLAACSNGNPTPVPLESSTPAPSGAPATHEAPAATPSAAPASSVAEGVDACALLSASDLSEIVGGAVHATAVPSGGWIAGQCAWNTPAGSFLISVGTADSLRKFEDTAAPDARAKLAEYKAQMGATGSVKTVAGVGEGAEATKAGIATYKGGTYVEIVNLGMPEEQLISIAKVAVSKF
jgi:hypothetical protein